VLGVGAVGYAGWYVGSNVANCVPTDFPQYPHTVWGGSSFGGSACREDRLTIDGSSRIIDFFATRLNSDNWSITSINRSIDRVDFKHLGKTHITGAVWLVDRTVFRAICLDFNKSPVTLSARLSLQARSAARGGDICSGAIPTAPG
jgi:hypothetical protein